MQTRTRRNEWVECYQDALEILNIRPLWNIETLTALEEEGVNFEADNYAILFWAEEYKKNDIVKYLKRRYI